MITDRQYREYMAQKNSAIPCENALPEAYDMTADQQIRAKALELAIMAMAGEPRTRDVGDQASQLAHGFYDYIREGK